MAPKRKPKPKAPWYKRPQVLILSAGALAAAILGVINLWEKVFPPPDADIATIESVHIIRRTPLSGFTSGGIGKDLALEPVAQQAAIGSPGTMVPVKPQLSPLPKPGPLPTFTFSPSPTLTTTTAPPDTPTPTSSTQTGSPSPSISPPPTPSPTFATLRPEVLSGLSAISDEYVESVADQEVMLDYTEPARTFTARSLVIEAVDDAGTPLPPEQVAVELAQALERVETTPGPDGKDPLGWAMAVRLDLEGLAQVPLLLTWSLDGLDVPDTWKAENLAYRVVGATPHDAGVAEIWVPDLKGTGAYNVNIKLAYESSGLIADLEPLNLDDPGAG
ncbi:hypothetical protein [Arthrobacter sp. AD-310]